MTIVYWDFLNGSDETGDGSAGNPYKTLSKATTGLTGGDEVRCAKSPDPATLPGTLTFTDGSKSVATSEDLTSVLGAYDFVSLNTAGETWWEISSITSTTITLVVAYRGTGGTGTGYKRGITGSIAGVTVADGSSATAVHTISASGASASSLLKLSFGWNLSGTPAQDGQTFFFQSDATNGGRGIYGSSKNYIEIDGERLGLLRYLYGIYGCYSSNNWTITSCTCNGNSYGIYGYSSSSNWTITSCTCNGNNYFGIYGYSSNNWTITSCTCNGNGYYGICGSSSSNWTITSCTCNGNSYGIYLITGCSNIVAYGYAHDESTWSNAGKIDSWAGNGQKLVSIQESESGGAARNRVYFYGGYTQDNTAEADGGSGKCIQFNPKSATYWIEQDFNVPVTSGVARTVSIKMKDDASFDGSVELELWYNGVLIVGPTTKTMTTSYVAQEMTATAGQIAADGVLVLKVKVYGTAGAVYADTLTYS